MHSGVCPKCNSSEIYWAYSGSSLATGLRTGDGQPMLQLHKEKGGIFGDEFTYLYLTYYVCRNCGYLEQYVCEVEELAKLTDAKNWHKVEQAS